MDPSPAGGGRRNKKRGSRSGGGGGGGGAGGGGGGESRGRPNGGSRQQQQQQRGRKRKRGRGAGQLSRATQDRLPPTAVKDDSSILGGRLARAQEPHEQQRELDGPPNGFGLFCAYHLGVTPDDGYQKPSLDETARRYGISHDEVRALLAEHKLDAETMSGTSFDLEGAKLDVRLAPEGISRIEIARDQYTEYLQTLES